LVIDALSPNDAQTLTDVDEELHFVVQVLSVPPGFCPVLENCFVIAVE